MKKYVFKPYSEIFPRLFDAEKKRIAASVGTAAEIEHVGSTAVPGLGGKGIIDIAIAVAQRDLETVSKQLQDLGYEFRPTFSTPDRLYFVIYLPDPEEETRRYHVHLTYPECSEWKELIGFREYLRNHPKEAQSYAEVKKRAALEANQDGEKYRQLKEHVFQKIKAMTHSNPKRIMILGVPGSGKSTFSAKLGKLLNISVHHLDRYMFEPGGKKRDKQEFLSVQKAMVDEEAWIIEGCSFSTFEMRFARADTVIYFRFPRYLCFWRVFRRLFNHDKAFGGLKVVNWGILKYIWNFDKEKRARIEELKKKYAQVDFRIFKRSKDADKYMKELKKHT
jgi:GrpB-like predicted nucleotidyltransferase (UPF0157 family)/adenylate kinase family enzyme